MKNSLFSALGRTTVRNGRVLGIIFGCFAFFAAGCAPHRTTEKDMGEIKDNLRHVYTAGLEYILEQGKTEVRYADLLSGTKYPYLKPLTPVSGESYDALVVTARTSTLSVKTADGREIFFDTGH